MHGAWERWWLTGWLLPQREGGWWWLLLPLGDGGCYCHSVIVAFTATRWTGLLLPLSDGGCYCHSVKGAQSSGAWCRGQPLCDMLKMAESYMVYRGGPYYRHQAGRECAGVVIRGSKGGG